MAKIKKKYGLKAFDSKLLNEQYTGDLAKPISAEALELIQHTSQEPEKWAKNSQEFAARAREFRARIEAEREKKLELLLEQFGIESEDPTKWKKLAIVLAIRDVPGMRVSLPHETNSVVWTDEKLANWLSLVNYRLSRSSNLSPMGAITRLLKEVQISGTARTLYNKYLQAKARPDIVRRANRFGVVETRNGGLVFATQISTKVTLNMTHQFWRPLYVLSSPPVPVSDEDGTIKQEQIDIWDQP